MIGYDPVPTDDYMTEIRVEGDLGGLLTKPMMAPSDESTQDWCPHCHQTRGHDEDCPNRHW